MQKVIIPILSISLLSTIIYASTIETNPEVIIDKENREKILECLEDVYTKKGTTDMILQIKECESIPLRSITWTGQLTPVSEPPSISRKSPLEDLIEDNWLDVLHEKVCQKQINSALCKDRALFDRLYHLTEERLPNKQFFPILLGITNAESSLGLNFAKDRVGWTCTGRNNWWGVKWKINDDWTREYTNKWKFWYAYSKAKPTDDYGCYLFPFDSIEDYWISKVNTFRFYYKGCIDHKTPIWCISWPYVWDRGVHEQSWIVNTSIFLD